MYSSRVVVLGGCSVLHSASRAVAALATVPLGSWNGQHEAGTLARHVGARARGGIGSCPRYSRSLGIGHWNWNWVRIVTNRTYR
jgi:hypothetical protein